MDTADKPPYVGGGGTSMDTADKPQYVGGKHCQQPLIKDAANFNSY